MQQNPQTQMPEDITLQDLIEFGHINPKHKPVQDDGDITKGMELNDWLTEAEKEPVPKMLFDEFWYEGEICVLFADTNVGKSILAMQISASITSGKAIEGFKFEADAQPVIYFDFELNKKQVQNRYSNNYQDNYQFDPRFIRVEIDYDKDIPHGKTFEDVVLLSIVKNLHRYQAKILVIDNLTYMSTDAEKGKEAGKLMKALKKMKSQLGLSILGLAHTPKRINTEPILLKDLKGSSDLANFCDSSFTIGKSFRDKSVRFIKQLKQRTGEEAYGHDNVCVCAVEKQHNFLGFWFTGYGYESTHLKQDSDEEYKALQENVAELHKQGLTQRKIAEQLGISLSKVNRILNRVSGVSVTPA